MFNKYSWEPIPHRRINNSQCFIRFSSSIFKPQRNQLTLYFLRQCSSSAACFRIIYFCSIGNRTIIGVQMKTNKYICPFSFSPCSTLFNIIYIILRIRERTSSAFSCHIHRNSTILF